MIEDMAARKLNPHTQRSHIYSCKRFAAWLKRSPDTATPDEVRRFQLYLMESGVSICNRNRIMTGVRFLFRITLRRHDLAALISIPIALPASQCPTSCDFVPWRFSDAGLASHQNPRYPRASENLHKTALSVCSKSLSMGRSPRPIARVNLAAKA
jgi:hypothetical protein